MALCTGIEVTVFEARNLRNASMLGLDRNDPYVTVECEAGKQKTTVKPNAGKAASWNEKLKPFAKSQILPSDTIRVRVWDRDHVSADDKIGGTIIHLQSVLDAGGFVEQWFVIYKNKMGGKTAGEVKLSIKIGKAAPAGKARSTSGAGGKALYHNAMEGAVAAPSPYGQPQPLQQLPQQPPQQQFQPPQQAIAQASYPAAPPYMAGGGYPQAAYPGGSVAAPSPYAQAQPPPQYPPQAMAQPGYPAQQGYPPQMAPPPTYQAQQPQVVYAQQPVPQVYAQAQQPTMYAQQPRPQMYAQAQQPGMYVQQAQQPGMYVQQSGGYGGKSKGAKYKGGKKQKHKKHKGFKIKFGKFGFK